VAPAERDRTVAAFERELTRLLRVHGLPDTASADCAVVSGLPDLPVTSSPRQLGRALARAVHGALSAVPAPGSASSPPPAPSPTPAPSLSPASALGLSPASAPTLSPASGRGLPAASAPTLSPASASGLSPASASGAS
jgi:hypothetical protein